MKEYLTPYAEIITFGEDIIVTSIGQMREDNDWHDNNFTEN